MGYLIYYVLEGKISKLNYHFPGLVLVLLIVASYSVLLLTAFVSVEEPCVWSEVTVEQSDNLLFISGTVTHDGEHAEYLQYQLNLERSGISGTTSTSQSGRIRVEPGEHTGISTIRINAGKGDICRITLKILDTEEKTISTSNLRFEIK